MTNLTLATATSEQLVEAALNSALESQSMSSFRQSYHEIADAHVVESDVLVQLRANMAQLEDLHGRLRFALNEVVYLTKKN